MTNNRTLKKENKRLREELDNLRKDYQQLIDEFTKLKKELEKYKNSNTPSSANKHLKPNTQGRKSRNGSKRGAPKGHKGSTRNQTPDRFDVVDAYECPNCHGHKLKDEKVYTRVTEETPEPVKPETVQTEIRKKKCLDCNLIFIPPQSTTPLKGKFGINLMVMVIFIKFILRGVLRKTASFLDVGFAFKITPSSLNAIVKRVAEAAEKEYGCLKTQVRTSTRVYVDETSFSVLGKNWWVLVFRTHYITLLIIRLSRGSNVLEEILGKGYAGTVICDCWRAYNFLSNATLQRCWAHLLRKSKEFSSVAGKHFHKKLSEIFDEIKAFNETVLVRKIIGAFRSEKGVTHYETLASLLATWKIQKLDIKAQLKQSLIKNLCFC